MALDGVRVIEFAGLAPGPFAGLILADWGADVVRIDRVGAPSPDTLARHKRSVALDTKSSAGVALARRLIARADVLIDPFRPGVMERMGLGPEVFLGDEGLNKRLIFARLAGFAPKGPHKDMAGHDINYLALSGVLSMLPGTQEKPSFPLNLLADFGGGGMTCALGVLLALIERSRSGLGQVVSTDMVSGTRYLSTFPLTSALVPPSPGSSLFRVPSFPRSLPASAPNATPRMQHTLDGGAPFYNIYTCADGRWMSIGCLEPRFYAAFLRRFLAALPENYVQENFGGWAPTLGQQFDREGEWPQLRRLFDEGFRLYGRDHWAKVFHGSDACAVSVLSPAEAGILASSEEARDGAAPAPHPLLSRTPARATASVRGAGQRPLLSPGAHTVEVLREVLLLDDKEIKELQINNVIGVSGEKSKL